MPGSECVDFTPEPAMNPVTAATGGAPAASGGTVAGALYEVTSAVAYDTGCPRHRARDLRQGSIIGIQSYPHSVHGSSIDLVIVSWRAF